MIYDNKHVNFITYQRSNEKLGFAWHFWTSCHRSWTSVLENLLVETIEKIQDQYQPSIEGSKDETSPSSTELGHPLHRYQLLCVHKSQINRINILNYCYKAIDNGNPNHQNWSQLSLLLWCNRHNVNQITPRDL